MQSLKLFGYVSCFCVLASCGGGGEEPSSSDASEPLEQDPIVISAPVSLEARVSNQSVELSWAAVEGASSYNLYYAQESLLNAHGVPDIQNYAVYEGGTTITNISSTSYEVGSLQNGSAYYFSATAINNDSESQPSTQITATPAARPLNDTGMTRGGDDGSGDSYTNCVSSVETPQDCHQGRDALATLGQLTKIGAGNAGFDFTKLDFDGSDLPQGADVWHCVRDNHTGLVWETKTDKNGEVGDSLHDADDSYTWYSTDPAINGGGVGHSDSGISACYAYDPNDPTSFCNTQSFVIRVNERGLCGFNDWRMPTREELRSIVDYRNGFGTIDTGYFLNNQTGLYWTSSPSYTSSLSVAAINFNLGSTAWIHRLSGSRIRLVRAEH